MKMISPTEMRKRLGSRLATEAARAKAAKERPAYTAASLGRELGDKDYIRDFLAGRKESLSMEAVLECERLVGLPHGSLHLAKAIIPSYDPDAPEQQLDPDAPPDVTSFPPDAIKELASKAGMGAGQTIVTTYVADGQETIQRDAIRDDYWRIPPDFVRSLLHAKTVDLLVVECDGDSMAPTLMPKERVIVNTAHRKISPDGLYAMRNQYEDVVIKRLELFGTAPPRVRIISDNPKHEPQERGLDEIDVVGKVVMGLKLF